MTSPDELRAQLALARDRFRDAMRLVASRWDVAPAPEAWSPRQVVEHVVRAEIWFASKVCTSCGYPGREAEPVSLATAEEGLRAFDEAASWSAGRLKYVTPEDLARPDDRFGTVAGIITAATAHLTEHAEQLERMTKAAR